MIEVKNLTKNYGAITAVRNVSFTIERGHVYGLLGPNGAGKSTIMNIITGCLAATDGTVTVNGHDIYDEATAAKSSIGYLPEIPPLYPEMTPREYLKFIAKAKKIRDGVSSEIERVSSLCGITAVSDRLIKTLSKGYRQRVGIAGALIGDPEIIILDEPTVGLDPLQLIEVRALISSLKEDHAVILSSHIMGEITAMCDEIIIMALGEVVAKGTLDELEESRKGKTVTVISSGECGDIKELLSTLEGVDYLASYPRGNYVKSVIETKEGYDVEDEITTLLDANGYEIKDMTSARVSLEDIFIRLTTEAAEKAAMDAKEIDAPVDDDANEETADAESDYQDRFSEGGEIVDDEDLDAGSDDNDDDAPSDATENDDDTAEKGDDEE
ncbi:MAG: ABC transporter ATP-binding protein [Clostridia bacterium]|nr:ABC transporter ATP-binding protein [Clostridia bacterium]